LAPQKQSREKSFLAEGAFRAVAAVQTPCALESVALLMARVAEDPAVAEDQ
jgi:hypothetical protein